MAGFSMILVYTVLMIMILVGLFTLGIIFLLIGLVTKKISKNQKKKAPKICIGIGSVCMGIPVCIILWIVISITISDITTSIKRKSYVNITDKWRNEKVLSQSDEADEAIAQMLKTADSGDKDGFAKFFTPNLQKKEKFKEDLDKFFEAYPKGLSEGEFEGGTLDSDGSYDDDGNRVRTESMVYEGMVGDEWYSIRFSFCYENTKSPDDVGITLFYIENLEADALKEAEELDETNTLKRDYPEDQYLVCNIVDDSEVTARLINNKAFIFYPTPKRSITLEQMKTYIEEYYSVYELIRKLGKPNVVKIDEHSMDHRCVYYYELVSDDGKPMYMYIEANYSTGEIRHAYPCSDNRSFFNQNIDRE